jgi:hypothetical protein
MNAVVYRSHFGLTLLPFIRGISRDRGVCAAIPPAGPISFDRAVLIAVTWGRPCFCIFIVRGSRELGTGGELQHLLVVGTSMTSKGFRVLRPWSSELFRLPASLFSIIGVLQRVNEAGLIADSLKWFLIAMTLQRSLTQRLLKYCTLLVTTGTPTKDVAPGSAA